MLLSPISTHACDCDRPPSRARARRAITLQQPLAAAVLRPPHAHVVIYRGPKWTTSGRRSDAGAGTRRRTQRCADSAPLQPLLRISITISIDAYPTPAARATTPNRLALKPSLPCARAAEAGGAGHPRRAAGDHAAGGRDDDGGQARGGAPPVSRRPPPPAAARRRPPPAPHAAPAARACAIAHQSSYPHAPAAGSATRRRSSARRSRRRRTGRRRRRRRRRTATTMMMMRPAAQQRSRSGGSSSRRSRPPARPQPAGPRRRQAAPRWRRSGRSSCWRGCTRASSGCAAWWRA